MEPPFLTDRLVLRRFVAQDLPDLAELHGDERVMRYLAGGTASLQEVQRLALPRFLRYDHCRPAMGRWALFTRADAAFVGWVALTRPPAAGNTEAELTLRLAPKWWGDGLATEAAEAVIARAFHHGLRHISATVHEENRAAQRVVEKLGFTLQRRYRPTPAMLARSRAVDAARAAPLDGETLEFALPSSERSG